MTKQSQIHRDVSEFYGKAVHAPSPGCCGDSVVAPKGHAAKSAGYTAKDLAALPDDAVENAFGCGNPVAFAEVAEGETVLDLGSGAGIDLLLAARRVGPGGHVIGVDMTDEMIAKARRNIADAGFRNIEVRKGLIEDLPVESNSVDWLFSNCVINLSPDKPKVFAEITRVLRPGGRMVVSDIVAQDLPDWVRRDKALYGACVAGAIDEQAYVAGLERAGLSEVRVTDRLIYDSAALGGLVASEIPGAEAALAAIGRSMEEVAEEIAGKVWSARFTARKLAA